MNLKSPLPALAFAFSVLFLVAPLLWADEIKLKSGEVLKGTVVFESEEMVRMEVAVTASIKETKVIARGDIESMVKTAPDDVDFEKVSKLVPTGSLLTAENYRQMLETGPDAFLRDHPGSSHVPKVQEIRDTLAKELDQVERGFIKIDEDWISPQERLDFKDLVDSRIRFLRMQNFAKGNNLASLIAAMREFEQIEKSYLGAPVSAQAVELAKEIVPNLGRQIQGLAANVDYQNAEFERSLAASTAEAQARIRAAREREDKTYADSVANDKKAGVKWVQLNPRSKPAIEEYLKLASTELTRLRTYDTAAIVTQGQVLVEADKLLAEGRVAEAAAKRTAAAAISLFLPTGGAKGDPKAGTKAPARPTTGKAGATGGGYLGSLGRRIDARQAEEREKAKAREKAAKSESLTANLRKSGSGTAEGAAEEDPDAPKEETEEADEAEAKPAPEVDEFAALAGAKKGKADAKGAAPAASSKAKSMPSKSRPAPSEDDDENVTPRPRPAPVEEEGGFPTWLIGPILTALVVIAIVVLKVLGIGVGKKEED
jgi:hypothetical protein